MENLSYVELQKAYKPEGADISEGYQILPGAIGHIRQQIDDDTYDCYFGGYVVIAHKDDLLHLPERGKYQS